MSVGTTLLIARLFPALCDMSTWEMPFCGIAILLMLAFGCYRGAKAGNAFRGIRYEKDDRGSEWSVQKSHKYYEDARGERIFLFFAPLLFPFIFFFPFVAKLIATLVCCLTPCLICLSLFLCAIAQDVKEEKLLRAQREKELAEQREKEESGYWHLKK